MKIKSIEIKKGKLRGDSMPDVDTDFSDFKRDKVKEYLAKKYGAENVCGVGTFSRIKIKTAIKDISRVLGMGDFQTLNSLTKMISDKEESSFETLILTAQEKPNLKRFLKKNPDLLRYLEIVLNSPRAMSTHASAFLILPSERDGDMNLRAYNWIPVKKIGGVLVSEWEGKYIDAVGILKNDILGLSQLSKFELMIDLIKEQEGDTIDIEKIKLNDKEVYAYFQKGWNEDVFQFNSNGLKVFSRAVQPDTMEDLIAMNALFRPGPMGMKTHDKFAEIKRGEASPEYPPLLKGVVESTLGLFVYQEQIMRAFAEVGFSLIEADEVRTIMKKKDAAKMNSVKDRFIKLYSDRMKKELKYAPKEADGVANDIWDTLVKFSAYGFNKSHSTAYAKLAYIAMWFKVYYPLQFYTVSMQLASEKEIPLLLREIDNMGLDIKVVAIDINKSRSEVTCNNKTNEIYCSTSGVKGVGASAFVEIEAKREEVGKFKSLNHFLSVVEKKKVGKGKIIPLILAGAFDSIEGLKSPVERKKLLLDYVDRIGVKSDERSKYEAMNDSEFMMIRKQKELTGIGEINFAKVLGEITDDHDLYLEPKDFFNKVTNKYSDSPSIVCGEVKYADERPYKNKEGSFCRLVLVNNNDVIEGILWDDFYSKDEVKKLIIPGKFIAIKCHVRFDDWAKSNRFYSYKDGEIWEI